MHMCAQKLKILEQPETTEKCLTILCWPFAPTKVCWQPLWQPFWPPLCSAEGFLTSQKLSKPQEFKGSERFVLGPSGPFGIRFGQLSAKAPDRVCSIDKNCCLHWALLPGGAHWEVHRRQAWLKNIWEKRQVILLGQKRGTKNSKKWRKLETDSISGADVTGSKHWLQAHTRPENFNSSVYSLYANQYVHWRGFNFGKHWKGCLSRMH